MNEQRSAVLTAFSARLHNLTPACLSWLCWNQPLLTTELRSLWQLTGVTSLHTAPMSAFLCQEN